MVQITFIEHNGRQHRIDVPEGESLMQAAQNNMVPGIDADCGGACACATCHVFVADDWIARLPAVSDNEDAMLDVVETRLPGSRLSCQLKAEPSLDGLVVTLPASQR
ncbi:2Fe-2S iron-sulfur cluster-binding protein [Solimonas terrae]|uniref:2Fe-2S iron-sulfur cluster binding domain-containing protein n=1 Tax=Solimonas terrae TaxID=1396819 RepID=A0A6M2BQG7_9GAMM|nr:2Fe-2S iron-sulfur cluster-binding protein [Solimonas terrae]NGY04313.1 2Fe-2S iron-sulfur cluster binding domain-containing protein [Solimonas terrae]